MMVARMIAEEVPTTEKSDGARTAVVCRSTTLAPNFGGTAVRLTTNLIHVDRWLWRHGGAGRPPWPPILGERQYG